jgi:hypothetical protein
MMILFVCMMFVSSCASVAPESNSPATLKIDGQVQANVYEVIAHLYRWYFDEVDVQRATASGNSNVWLRELHPALDSDDKSKFRELILPGTMVGVLLKKADYKVAELGVHIKSDRFVIARVERLKNLPRNLKNDYQPIILDGKELRDYLFDKRGETVFPDEKQLQRLRSSAREELIEHFKDSGRSAKIPENELVIHIAPVSPVANEIWVFWEYGRVLVRFSSDMAFDNEQLWLRSKLNVKIYDIDKQVVVSLQEVPGSNAYLTRDQVGRALYNCIILGRKYNLRR